MSSSRFVRTDESMSTARIAEPPRTEPGFGSMPMISTLPFPNRRIRLWAKQGETELSPGQLEVVEVIGEEALGSPYEFRLKLRSEATGTLPLEALIGADARVSVVLPNPDWAAILAAGVTGPTRDFCGVLSEVTFDGVDDNYGHYTATLRPHIWKLSLNRRFRQFLGKTTKEIGKRILGNLPVRWDLGGASVHREYCVQYDESDLTFLSRLLEEDGLFYFFEHQYTGQPNEPHDRQERLVITDRIKRDDDDTPPIEGFDTVQGGNRSRMRIRQWREIRRVVPQGFVSLDRTFQRPKKLVRDSDDLGSTVADAAVTVTAYPSGVARRIDEISAAGEQDTTKLATLDTVATADATIRKERAACERSGYEGGGDVATLQPGRMFLVSRDGVVDPHAYYVTRVEHTIRLANLTRSGASAPIFEYRNEFGCQSELVAHRPLRSTPKPIVGGVVAGTVINDTAVTEDDVCVDRYGRVKVRFPWQPDDDAPGCWIRVSQFWAGNRWGSFFWPRVGHEVLVAFEHGDPDRPVVVGSVYNFENMPPLPLPEHKLSGGIHSCTHKGDGTQQTSCVVFHDRPDAEYLQLHSETYHSLTCETETLKWAAGHDVTFKGHNWIFDLIGGSGGGGSDFTGYDGGANVSFKKPEEGEKSPSAGEVFADIFAIANEGSTTYSVGDSYTKRFGRSFETYYGSNIWIGCDPIEFVEFLLDKLEIPVLGLIAPLAFGAGGIGKTVFGGKHDLQFGTEVKVHEGKTIKRTGPKPTDGENASSEGNSTPLDGPCRKIVHVLLAIILMMDLLVMLLTKAALTRDSKAWKGYLEFSEIWSLMILPRLQGLLEFISTESSELNETLFDSKKAAHKSTNLAEDVAHVATVTDDTASVSRERAESEVEETADSVRRAASAAEDDEEEEEEESDGDDESDDDGYEADDEADEDDESDESDESDEDDGDGYEADDEADDD